MSDAVAGSQDIARDIGAGPKHHPRRLESVHIMRGLASAAVMMCHLTFANGNFRGHMQGFSALFDRGYLGVWMFFVISGFVIPHSMHTLNYRFPRDAWAFFARRLVRLEPPYILSVLLAVAIGWGSSLVPGYRGAPYALDLPTFLLQFLYLVPWFNLPWINGVAWTLAIEFQYYVLMLFLAPLLLSNRAWRRWLFLAIVAAISLLTPDRRAILLYLPCFALGFSAFLFFHRRIGVAVFLALLAGFAVLTGWRNGYEPAVVGAVSALLIFVPVYRPLPVLSFLGSISYSLYLLHSMIGDRIINVTTRLPGNAAIQLSGLALAVGVSVLLSWLFWRFVEKPAIQLSRRVA